ncbi:MAG: DUF4435 domain-containing protein [Prevotella sp.]
MMKRLTENISSKYLEAANSMRQKAAKRRIIAYVESYDDILFWRSILSDFEDDTRYFEVMLPSHTTLQRGKRSVLMNLLCSKVGRNMIACVDADYDYLLQGATLESKIITNNKYVFHTYAYAIENLQCYAPSLHNVCVMATLNDHAIFDFNSFLKEFSIIIFPLFVWSVWHYRRGIYNKFTITDFNKVLEIGKVDVYHPETTLDMLKRKIDRRCLTMKRIYRNSDNSYAQLKKELIKLGVTPETTYLYIQGHHLFDKIVAPIITKVCSVLIREREAEIRRQAIHDTQMRNELSCYSHSTLDIEIMLKKNMGYFTSKQFINTKKDIETFLNDSKEQENA